jgi:hypothetical protein
LQELEAQIEEHAKRFQAIKELVSQKEKQVTSPSNAQRSMSKTRTFYWNSFFDVRNVTADIDI